MNAALVERIREVFAAQDRFNTHMDNCHTCISAFGLCADGRKLHTAYARIKNRVEGNR